MKIIITCFFAVIVSGTSLRETRPTLPCFMNGIDDPVYEQSLISWVQNIHDQMTYFKSRCKELNRTMLLNYCVEPTHLSFLNRHYLNTAHAAVEKIRFMHELNHNDLSFLEKMRFHYDNLNELASYVEQLLPSSGPYMEDLQSNIYASMCSLKMALRSQNQDPISRVPDGEVSGEFMEYAQRASSSCDQQQLEYIIVLDSLRIARYLETLYGSF